MASIQIMKLNKEETAATVLDLIYLYNAFADFESFK
jgi:hypothetical protein